MKMVGLGKLKKESADQSQGPEEQPVQEEVVEEVKPREPLSGKKQLIFDLVTPRGESPALHSREQGVTVMTSPSGKTDSEPTDECWGGGGAFEMLYEP